MKKIASILLTCYLFIAVHAANAQGLNSVSHSPNPAFSNNNISLQLEGYLPNACWYVNDCTWYWWGNALFIAVDFNYNPSIPNCGSTFDDWSRNVPLGTLAAGNYTVEVYNENYGHFLGSYGFTVNNGCQAPTASQIFASGVTCTSATLSCSVPGIQGLKARYKPVNASNWLTVVITSGNSITINNLIPNTQYEFQINVCNTEAWSPSKFFTTCLSSGTGVCSNPYTAACGNTYSGNNGNGVNNYNSYSGAGVNFTQMYGPEIFYELILAQSGPISISLTGLAAGKDLDLIVLSSCNSNSIVAYSGNANNSSEYINVTLPAGTYKIVVDGWNYAVSNYTLTVNCANACATPTANQIFASLVTSSSARLNCSVGASFYDWRYRVVGGGAWTNLNHTSTNYTDITLLNPFTNYEFQCSVYCNGLWTSWSPSQFFNTTGGGTLPNDEPCGAVELVVQYDCIPVYGSNVNASTSWVPSPPASCNTSNMRDVWFKVQIPNTGKVKISTFAGSMTDAVVAFYFGNCNNLVGGNPTCFDDTNNDLMPDVTITGNPGTYCYIRIWGYNGFTGTFSMCAQTVFNLQDDDYTVSDTPDSGNRSNEIVNKGIADGSIEPRVSSLQLFPVPTQDILTVKSALAIPSDVHIKILNLAGQIVLEEMGSEVPEGEFEKTMDVSSLPTGTYLLRFQTEGQELTQKFVKL
ncbi:MAG: T9SS type A sorting domain-containing protein [Saprospiraceae bacterium]|nr:T9SS type A sorting domain-containing protein [Saprospiraceae bacterium]